MSAPTGDEVLTAGFVGEIPKGCRTVLTSKIGAGDSGTEVTSGAETSGSCLYIGCLKKLHEVQVRG